MTYILKNISQLYTLRGVNRLRMGQEMSDVETLSPGFIVVQGEKIVAVGSGEDYQPFVDPFTQIEDGFGCVVTPGFVDSHTHLVHGGSRESEWELKLQGIPYLEILKQGGGILSTVRSTRSASFESLVQQAKQSLNRMLLHGVTTVEAKSGYGLNLETELKQLRVAKWLNEIHPIDVVSTYLGAHALPEEYQHLRFDYIKAVISWMDEIKREDLAEFCDVFCEEGVFDLQETETILKAAKMRGFKLKLHADEMHPLGGARLGANLGCISCDHMMATETEDYELLKEKRVVCNVLPSTSFNLNKEYAHARKMIDSGCGVAISSDYNPGSAPSENLQLSMSLATLKMKLLPKEVLTAVTLNGACSLTREQDIGSLEVGKKADFVVFKAPNWEYILYHYGINLVQDVYKNGIKVVSNQQICDEVKE